MAKKEIAWEKVSFDEKPKANEYKITFRTNGQIVFAVESLAALEYPQYINFYYSPDNNLIALKSSGKSDGSAIRLGKEKPTEGKPHSFFSKKVYAWLLDLLKQKQEMVVQLIGKPDGDMLVFDLKKAEISPKRVRGTKA